MKLKSSGGFMAQPIPQNYMAYDRTIVVFSPDGRLLQVEYARQMVKNGTTSLGIKLKDGVLLGSVRTSSPLAVTQSYKKIYEIDENIAAVSAGSLADARNLIDMARVKAQINMITFGEPISVTSLTKAISDRKHLVTQYAGVRPYGVGMLIGGVDKTGAKLFETEPSGTMIEWNAQAIGRGADKARKALLSGWKEGMELKPGAQLLVKALRAGEKDARTENIEAVYVKKGKIERVSLKEAKKG
jgi:proteasome alpha subunit